MTGHKRGRCGVAEPATKRPRISMRDANTKPRRNEEPIHALSLPMNEFKLEQPGNDMHPCLVFKNRTYLPMHSMRRGTFGFLYTDGRTCIKYLPTSGGASTRGQLLIEMVVSRILMLLKGTFNIVAPVDLYKSDAGVAIGMPLAHVNLSQVMFGNLRCTDQDSSIPLRTGWARDMVRGVLHLHRHVGVLHLDIKPPNVVLRGHGSTACLIDFGLSEFAAGGQGLALTDGEPHLMHLTVTKRGYGESPLMSRRLSPAEDSDGLIADVDKTLRTIGILCPAQVLRRLVRGMRPGGKAQSVRVVLAQHCIRLSVLPPVHAHHYQTSWYRHPRQFDKHRGVRAALCSRGVEGRLRRLDELSDYWAVMVIIYELLTRRMVPLFSAKNIEPETQDAATAKVLVAFLNQEGPEDAAEHPGLACDALRMMRDRDLLRMGDTDTAEMACRIQSMFLRGDAQCDLPVDAGNEVKRLRLVGKLLSHGGLDPTMVTW